VDSVPLGTKLLIVAINDTIVMWFCHVFWQASKLDPYGQKDILRFLADRTNGRAYATVLRLSVCDVMYCG